MIEGVKGSGKEYYKYMSPDDYKELICTPSGNKEYFEKFNRPLVQRMIGRFGSPIRVLDIGCGPADELIFLKDDPNVKIIATDISSKILHHAKETLNRNSLIFASDAENSPIKKNVAEAGILVNMIIYSPDSVLKMMHDALLPGGQCSVNFRIFDNVSDYIEFFLGRGGKKFESYLKLYGLDEKIPVNVLDYTNVIGKDGLPNLPIRQLGEQTFFKSVDDVRKLISWSGFKEIENHPFNFVTKSDRKNSQQVFILEKPVNGQN